MRPLRRHFARCRSRPHREIHAETLNRLRSASGSALAILVGITAARVVGITIGAVATSAAVAPRTIQQHLDPTSAAPTQHFSVGSGAFIENRGQWSDPASFLFRDGTVRARLERDKIWLDLSGESGSAQARVLLELAFVDASPMTRLEPSCPVQGAHHFLFGPDSSAWRTDVRTYGTVRWTDVRPGVSLTLAPGRSGEVLEYALACEPGTGSRPLAFRLRGADALALDDHGALVARTGIGDLRQTPPKAWEELSGGARRMLAARFVLIADDAFTIEVADRDDDATLSIDPGLEWAGYVGGSGLDFGRDLVLTSAGEPVVVGYTDSWDFPTTPGVLQPGKALGQDAFVMKVSADGGSIVFATYIGGIANDLAFATAIEPSNVIAIAGRTSSTDFPLTAGAFDTSLAGDDAFVLKLSADGKTLRFGTLLGGSASDYAFELELASDGDAIVAGSTTSSDFPASPVAAQSAHAGSWDGFVARVRSDGSALEWATYLGGANDQDFVYALALDADESVLAGGWAESPDFPVTPGAFDTVHGSSGPSQVSGFVTRISANGSTFVFSTFLDGSNSAVVNSLSVSAAGRIAAAGSTTSPDYPVTAGAWYVPFGVDGDGFVSILTPDGSALVYSTAIGTSTQTEGLVGAVLEDSGAFTVFGSGPSFSFPTTPGAYDSVIGGAPDAFVMRFKPDGSGPLYSSLLGGHPGTDVAAAHALDATGRVVLLGALTLGSFPVTPGSFDSSYAGGPPFVFHEGTLAKLELQPLGVTAFGTSTAACKGPIRLTALGEPKAGNASFAIACTGAPPGALGVLAIAGSPFPGGLPVLGATIYLDLSQPPTIRSAIADALGYDEIALPIPAATAGAVAYVQAAWLDTGGCGGSLALIASDALAISIAAP